MGGVVEIAGAILSRAFERSEVAAQNLTNMTTPGYKARQWFPASMADAAASSAKGSAQTNESIDFSPGKFQNTGSAFDLAISGAGFFAVRSDQDTFYTRDGQFSRGADGKIVTADGLALQSATGGDIAVSGNNPKILSDGTVLDNGQPVARVGVVDFSDLKSLRSAGAGRFSAPSEDAETASATIHQGMLEASNVSTADQMIAIMAALRSAESGQKIVQLYDDMMGQAISAFGQT
jgi:flagellar basal-body rod protein FlgG